MSLCHITRQTGVLNPLIHFHQGLLHALGRGELLLLLRNECDLSIRKEKYFSHFKALCEYSDCLLLLPASNIAMRRDVQEGQARCLSRLGRHKEALDIAEKMRNSATNTDHLTTVLNLQFSIYQALENVEKKIMCLQQLICLHPFNPWFWKLLAEAYMSLLQNLSPLVIPEANLNQSEEVCVSNSSFKTSTGREINLQPHRSDGQKEGPWFSLVAETKGENAVTCPSSQKVGIKACASFIRLLFSVCIFNLNVCFRVGSTNLEAPYCCFRSKKQNLLSVVAVKSLNLSGKSKLVSHTVEN
uniref:Chromosome 8 open reading frame 76 n=1 Tax=Ficedula albicollis TaxID=59894 RepID=U3JIE8_FICAL